MGAPTVSDTARELREFAKAGLRDSGSRHRLRLRERAAILWNLAPVQLAGNDSKAQYEYLIQAVIDAIDVIGQAASPLTLSPSPSVPSEAAREAQALRALFGLTSHTRVRTWRVRQEEAAAVLNMSWDYFRHDAQDELLQSLAEQILRASFVTRPPSMFDNGPGVRAYATQKDIEDQTQEYIYRERPRRAAMLEFSTATTKPILKALRDVDASIHLLVANPEKVLGWHESRMRQALDELVCRDLRSYDKLAMRCYSVPPALRGRQIGELIVLGWYTYRDNKRVGGFDPARVEVWGHDNAIIAARNSDADGAVLATWFSREFERLWTHRSTLDETVSKQILNVPD